MGKNEVTFYSRTDRYDITFAWFLIFAVIFGLIVVGATLYGTGTGPIYILWAAYLIMFGGAFFLMLKDWPKCPNDGARLKVVKRELKMPGHIYLTWRCPKGDYNATGSYVQMGRHAVSEKAFIKIGKE